MHLKVLLLFDPKENNKFDKKQAHYTNYIPTLIPVQKDKTVIETWLSLMLVSVFTIPH